MLQVFFFKSPELQIFFQSIFGRPRFGGVAGQSNIAPLLRLTCSVNMSDCATVLPGQSCHVPRHREQSEILFNRNPKFRAIPDFDFKIGDMKENGDLKNINIHDYTILYMYILYTDMDE